MWLWRSAPLVRPSTHSQNLAVVRLGRAMTTIEAIRGASKESAGCEAPKAGKHEPPTLPGVLRRMNTPSRAAARQVAESDATRDGSAGPQPWLPSDGSSAPAASSMYREKLQARGQQAMMRSLPTAMTQVGTPTVAAVTSPGAMLTTQLLLSMPRSRGPPPPPPQQPPTVPTAAPGAGGVWTPTNGIVSPSNPSQLCYYNAEAYGQQEQPWLQGGTPMNAFGNAQDMWGPTGEVHGYHSAGGTPVNGLQSQMSQQDLWATVMPSAAAMTGEQIAEQLRALADSSGPYED
jgi:hypothetical protein